jgi:surface-anchored protein
MKHPLLILSLLANLARAGLVPIGGHVDIRCHYETGSWNFGLRTSDYTSDPTNAPDGVFEPNHAVLSLADKLYVNGSPAASGSRFSQPASSSFAFTGAEPGEPIWLAVQGTPGIGEAWPGFDNDQPAGTFGSYIPNDSRVPQGNARPFIRISLVDYQPPHGKASHFSMWNSTSGQPPTIWMSTFDSSVENSYYYAAGSHTHMWWGFTATGIHRVTLQASAFLGPGETNPTASGDPFTLIFAVGTLARWQAGWFDAAELDNPAISNLFADADRDGLSNFLEYAFGTHPRSGAAVPLAEGLGMPSFSLVEENDTLYQTLVYPRRRAGLRFKPEIYQPLFAESPAGPWSDAGVTTTAADFPPAQDALNADWELVTSRRPVPSGATAGFGRVAVTPGEGIVAGSQ